VLGSTLVRCPSPTGSCNVQRVAPYWLPALPPRRSRRPRGLPRRALPWNVSPAICPRGVRCLFRVLGFASARPPLLRPGPFKKEPGRSWSSGSASRGVLAPPDTVYVGCPFSATRSLSVARVGRELPHSRRCRPQGSCPSRRFRLARGSLEVFWTPPFAVAPDASRPFFMPLASLELPSRAFPSRGAAPALAGRFFLAGSRSTVAGAVPAGASRSLSPLFAPAICPRTRPKADPGLMSRDDGSLRSLVRSPRPAR